MSDAKINARMRCRKKEKHVEVLSSRPPTTREGLPPATMHRRRRVQSITIRKENVKKQRAKSQALKRRGQGKGYRCATTSSTETPKTPVVVQFRNATMEILPKGGRLFSRLVSSKATLPISAQCIVRPPEFMKKSRLNRVQLLIHS